MPKVSKVQMGKKEIQEHKVFKVHQVLKDLKEIKVK